MSKAAADELLAGRDPVPTVLDVMRAVGALGFERMRITELVEEYAKHTALNLGQALQGLRYLTSHPDIDAHAPRGTPRHAARSVALRSKRIVNDLFFATIPPHWHHTREELAAMKAVRIGRWFQYGYCAWRFEESGEPRATIDAEIDRRWDPRCRSSVVLDRDVD